MAKLLQVLFRQARKNRLVYLILAEYRLILPEAPGSAGRPRNHPLVIGLQRTTWKDRLEIASLCQGGYHDKQSRRS